MDNVSDMRVSRRTLLKTSGSTLIAMTIMPTGAILGAGNAWAAQPKSLNPETFATLVQACRDIYPHDHLAESYYAKVVQGFDAAADSNKDDRYLFEDGALALDQAAQSRHGVKYIDTGWEIQRVNILRGMQDGAFFQRLRGTLVTGIYNNPDVWPMFGYEGESASKGGYLTRGFDDIDWLDTV